MRSIGLTARRRVVRNWLPRLGTCIPRGFPCSQFQPGRVSKAGADWILRTLRSLSYAPVLCLQPQVGKPQPRDVPVYSKQDEDGRNHIQEEESCYANRTKASSEGKYYEMKMEAFGVIMCSQLHCIRVPIGFHR